MDITKGLGWLAFLLLLAAMAGCAVYAAPPVVVAPQPQAVAVDIPKGHYPPPGSCRIWVPGVPPGQQSPPGPCGELQHRVPPGAVLVGR
jgi:hypothetical protein